MKKYLLMGVGLMVWGQAALATDALLINGCHDPKPEKVAWIVEVERDHNGFGYCYARETHDYIGFPCEVEGEVARAGDQVLGYSDFECFDIGHLPGYHFIWTRTHVAVKIFPKGG